MNINNDVLSLIKDATSIFGFIGGTPTKPQSITEEEVNNILSKVKQSHDSPRPKVMYQVGSVIRVVEGPFADFEATVEQVDYEKNTMKVSVAIFGRPTPVSLSFDNVTSC
jgi:transcriptional antiterminator NusG